jgi:hypothetical protein
VDRYPRDRRALHHRQAIHRAVPRKKRDCLTLWRSRIPRDDSVLAYYSSQVRLFGAEFTAVYASDCGPRIIPTEDAVAVGEPAKTDEQMEQSKGTDQVSP